MKKAKLNLSFLYTNPTFGVLRIDLHLGGEERPQILLCSLVRTEMSLSDRNSKGQTEVRRSSGIEEKSDSLATSFEVLKHACGIQDCYSFGIDGGIRNNDDTISAKQRKSKLGSLDGRT